MLPLSYYPKTIYVEPSASFGTVQELVTQHQFYFPFVVKPDVGMKGLLFRKIDTKRIGNLSPPKSICVHHPGIGELSIGGKRILLSAAYMRKKDI